MYVIEVHGLYLIELTPQNEHLHVLLNKAFTHYTCISFSSQTNTFKQTRKTTKLSLDTC